MSRPASVFSRKRSVRLVFGVKYLDVNLNGIFDDGDTPFSNCISSTNSSGTVGDVFTDVSGFFRFSNLTPGDYTLSEVVQPGYVNMSAKTLERDVAVESDAKRHEHVLSLRQRPARHYPGRQVSGREP